MLYVKRLVLGQLSTNCYILYNFDSKEAVIVDPGDDADYIIRVLTDLELVPKKIIATHGHFDHLLAVTEIKLAYNIPFYLNHKDKFLLKKIGYLKRYYPGHKGSLIPEADFDIDENTSLGDNWDALVISTPGHTPGSISIYCPQERFVVSGDLVFANGGLGRVDFHYSQPKKLKNSVDKLLKMKKDTLVYPGHGSGFNLGEEKKQIENGLKFIG